MAEIKDFKQDKGSILKFLTLTSDLNKISDDALGVWRRIIGGKKNLSFILYNLLLKSKKGEFTEDLSGKTKEPIHNVRRALTDLTKIGLIVRTKRKRNRVLSDFWRIKIKVDGMLRLFSAETTKSSEMGNEEFWHEKYKEISKLFTNYTGYNWINSKEISWKIEKNGIMNYKELRKYLKLTDTSPPINYITLFAKNEEYILEMKGSDGNLFEIAKETYEHPNKKLNIVNAIIPQDIVKNQFRKLDIGETFFLEIQDNKRLYTCPKSQNIFMACFIYQINLENINTLRLTYKFHHNTSPTSCGIWFDNHKEFEINLSLENTETQKNINWETKFTKSYIEFSWKGQYLLNKAQIIKFLFQLEPKYESDQKEWIKLYKAVDCPFCYKIPFETIGRM